MTKSILRILAILLIIIGCSKEEQNFDYATDDAVPVGWDTQEQTIIINDKLYNITVAGDPQGDGIKFLNSPNEVEKFFEKYDETVIPFVVQGKNRDVVFYFKDIEEFNTYVKFESGTTEKSYFGGCSQAWEHSSLGYTGGWGENILDCMQYYYPLNNDPNSLKFWNNSIAAYGRRSNWLNSSIRNKISSVLIAQFNFDEPIHYVGYNLDYWKGKKVVISKTSAYSNNTVYLWTLRMAWLRNWNDKINSYETWQSQINLNTDVNI